MRGKKNKKLLLLIVAILVVRSSTVFAAPNNLTTLKGWFTDIKIFSNGQQVKLDTKPLVINNTTYVPVRALNNVLNKEIEWKQDTFSIYINDKPDANYNYVLMQLFEKQDQITKLEVKIKELENQLEEAKSTKISSLSDMQKYLNKEYGAYEKIGFDIILSGSAKSITVKIYIDERDNSKWNLFSKYSSDVKSYVKNVVTDIKKNFPNATVTGYIENDYTGRTVVKFNLDSKGKLTVDTSYSGSSSGRYSLRDMQNYLNDHYYYEYGAYFEYEVYGDKDEVDIIAYVTKSDWNYLTSSEVNSFLKAIYSAVEYDFPYADIYIEVRDYQDNRLDYYNY